MSKPRRQKISIPGLNAKTKILFSSPPGKMAALVEGGKMTAKKFSGPHAALDWAIANEVAFFFTPADPVSGN